MALRPSKRITGLRPTAVNRVLTEASQLQAAGRDLVSLMRGQPDFPTPMPIVEAAERALRAGRTGYADNRGETVLRRAVAEALLRDHNLSYDPNREILITDGATCGISAALSALIEAEDEVLLPDPVYDAYASPIALWGGQAVAVPTVITVASRFEFDLSAFEAKRTLRTRGLLLNSPWNPVGTVLTVAEWQDIIAFAERHDLFIVSDEIYEKMIYDGRSHISPAGLSPEARARTILVNSLSKTYSMTGWRVGYCAGPAQVIDAMALVLQQWSRGPATFVQDAAAFALRGDQECVGTMNRELTARRDRVVTALSGIPHVRPLVPEGGLFVMLDVRALGLPEDTIRRRLLQEAGVVLIHGSAYGPGGEGTLRVSFAAGGANLDKGLERLRQGLVQLGKQKDEQGAS